MAAWGFNSCSIVPVGLTKFREGLSKLRAVDRETAGQVIDQVDAFGARCLERYGSRMFFCSDELYIRAGRALPEEEYYEDYVQIENGVGMLRSLITEFEAGLRLEDGPAEASPYTISTGVLSSEMHTGIASVPLATKELMRVGYIVHNERQLSDLAQRYIEKLSLFVEGYQIGLAGL